MFEKTLKIELSPIPQAYYLKKSLKIPKGLLESINRRRGDNTMAKRKGTKGTNIDLQYHTHKTR
jgi:hypothetical protein